MWKSWRIGNAFSAKSAIISTEHPTVARSIVVTVVVILIVQDMVSKMGIVARIIGWFNGAEEEIDYVEYEIKHVRRIISRFKGFAGVYVTDFYGNELDPDNLPNPNAPDGGADWVIRVEPEDYTEQGYKAMKTRVENILRNM